MKQNFKNHLAYGLPAVSLAVLILLFNLVGPLEVGPLGILAIFALMYVFVASLLFLALRTVSRLAFFLKPGKPHNLDKKFYYVASIVACGPIFLLALSSIGQLETKDFVLVVVLISLASFYVMRRT